MTELKLQLQPCMHDGRDGTIWKTWHDVSESVDYMWNILIFHLKVSEVATGKQYALKRQKKSNHGYIVDQHFAEKDILISAASQYVMPLMYAFQSANHVYLVLELATCKFRFLW